MPSSYPPASSGGGLSAALLGVPGGIATLGADGSHTFSEKTVGDMIDLASTWQPDTNGGLYPVFADITTPGNHTLIKAGMVFRNSGAAVGTVGTRRIDVGERIVALIDSAGNLDANWQVLEAEQTASDVFSSSTAVAGWAGPVLGIYSITVLQTAHLKGTNPDLTVITNSTGRNNDYETDIAANGDIVISTTEVPDGRLDVKMEIRSGSRSTV